MVVKDKDCIFCKIIKREIPAKIVGESNGFIAFLDAHPKTDGHTLVVPKKHYVTLLDLPNRLGGEMLEFVKKIASGLLDDKRGDGFNILMNNLECAGQIVKHAHIHVIPRKEGDGVLLG